jgi:beta-phosphoglucomutase-like phosphatase (HAD superfamily)
VFAAVIFHMDSVVTDTASVHAAACHEQAVPYGIRPRLITCDYVAALLGNKINAAIHDACCATQEPAHR